MNRKTVVLCIRGWFSPFDGMTLSSGSSVNLTAVDGKDMSSESNIVGRAHEGMVEAAKNIAKLTMELVSAELAAHKDYSLVIVGHSMGGAVASCLAAMWKHRFEGHQVKSIGYGTFPVFDLATSKQLDNNIMTVEMKGDLLGKWSCGHISDMCKAISKLCQDKQLREGILRRTELEDLSNEDFEWCAEAMSMLRTHMNSEKHYPPGKVYMIAGPLFENEEETTTIKSTNTAAFNEWKLEACMFDLSLHIPGRYERVLKRLASLKQGKGTEAH